MSSQGLQLTSKLLDVLLKNVWNVQGRGPRFCRGALCVLAASHVLARLRLLPDVVLRAIFLFHLIGTAVTTNVLIKGVDVLRALGILKNDTASGACAVITAAMFRWSRYGSPHMPVRLLPGSLPSFASMKTPNAVLVNHVGLFDTILYLWVVNPTYMMTMKTFYKAQLINVPLLGPILRSSQMLPVYFVTDRGDEFRVEKEKQIAVLKRTDEVLTAGWSISFYPEGAMNRSNPRNLQPFRFGTFNKIIEYKLNVYYMLHVGSEVTWPLGQSFGGRATPIYLYYGKIDVDYTADPTMDAQRLATMCQTQMQEKLDWMYSLVDSGKV